MIELNFKYNISIIFVVILIFYILLSYHSKKILIYYNIKCKLKKILEYEKNKNSPYYNKVKFVQLKIYYKRRVICMKSPYTDSLAHTTYECKYHIVFSPKYRRKEINGNLRTEIGMILRELSN